MTIPRRDTLPNILFPSDPTRPSKVDPGFEEEFVAAREAGFQCGFVNGGFFGADFDFYSVPRDSGFWLYRGWILSYDSYTQLAERMTERRCFPLTNEFNYKFSNCFPDWYTALPAGSTPRSWWCHWEPNITEGIDEVTRQLQKLFGDQPFILKDFVKSRKHEWDDACFIAHVDDAPRVIRNFIERQADSLVGGLVFREFVRVKRLGWHPKSTLPLSKEYRYFIRKDHFHPSGDVILASPYWSEAEYPEEEIPGREAIQAVLECFHSPFFVLDVVELEDGSRMVLEVNDGGTAGIPMGKHREFYQALKQSYASSL